MLTRALVGFLAALALALAGRRAGALSTSGAIAATAMGVAVMAAGYGWGALLALYFVSATALSKAGAARKEARTSGVVDKGGARDATQVLANGGVFAAAALGSVVAPAALASTLAVAALGALAASEADTWATEIGTWLGRAPRSLLTLEPVPPGTSGGVTIAGCVAMVGGALFVALVAEAAGLGGPLAAVFAGGIAGAMADTVLGATVQERRWCATCEKSTEQLVHRCGTPTSLAGGLAWLDNDWVNFLSTAAGALVAAAFATL